MLTRKRQPEYHGKSRKSCRRVLTIVCSRELKFAVISLLIAALLHLALCLCGFLLVKNFAVIFPDLFAVISLISELTVNSGRTVLALEMRKARLRFAPPGSAHGCLASGPVSSLRLGGSSNPVLIAVGAVATCSVDFFTSDHVRLTRTPARISVVDIRDGSTPGRQRTDQGDYSDHSESDPEPWRKRPGSHIGIRRSMRACRIASCIVPLDVAIGTVGRIGVTSIRVRTNRCSVSLAVASS